MDATTSPKGEISSLPGVHTSASTCQLCLEVIVSGTSTEGVTLSTCLHSSCKTCLAKWIEHEEASGQTAPPTCPFCRSIISSEDVQVILGRAFKPRDMRVDGLHEEVNDAPVDDLTQQWLDENTIPCGGCGFPTEKIDGCDLVECLCGFRFCFGCGQAASRNEVCECGGYFDDGDEGLGPWDLSRSNDSGTPIRDGEGHIDFRLCIKRADIRRGREGRQWTCQREEYDRWDDSEFDSFGRWHYGYINNACTATGSWLFTPKNDHGCILMLGQQAVGQVGYYDLQKKKRDKQRDETNRWAYSKFDKATCTANGSWLFHCKGPETSILMLANQLGNIRCQAQMNTLYLPRQLEELEVD